MIFSSSLWQAPSINFRRAALFFFLLFVLVTISELIFVPIYSIIFCIFCSESARCSLSRYIIELNFFTSKQISYSICLQLFLRCSISSWRSFYKVANARVNSNKDFSLDSETTLDFFINYSIASVIFSVCFSIIYSVFY